MKKVQRTLNFHTYKKLFCANCDVIANTKLFNCSFVCSCVFSMLN